MRTTVLLLLLLSVVIAQRPGYLGGLPAGYPALASRFKEENSSPDPTSSAPISPTPAPVSNPPAPPSDVKFYYKPTNVHYPHWYPTKYHYKDVEYNDQFIFD
ncbi:hypothetical protein PPYR_02478 [Photinus pyralis]|uniref:Uncharacterized protein n=1 Tax=Photinus pyralis TaxID=7054 RepID=A0A5N4B7I3_PHOPY|nr:hypothetical protein PPYR_02478 [Photinus pyralis]